MAEEEKKPEVSEEENVEATDAPEPAETSEAAEATPVDDQAQADKQKPKVEEEITEMTNLHERTIAVLSYFGFLAIVPFYLKKDSKFCRYHGKQGMTLAIIFYLFKLVAVLDIIMDLMLILQAALALWLGFAALSGKWKRAPIVYKWSVELETVLSLKTKEEEAEEAMLKPNETGLEEDEVPAPGAEPASTESTDAPAESSTEETAEAPEEPKKEDKK